MIDMARQRPTVQDYQRIFELERLQLYPTVSAFEERMGYAVDRTRLESAARVLACPLKVHPPNWQHGRVLYAVARKYLSSMPIRGIVVDPPGTYTDAVTLLDIGTAKGFSALCLAWALHDAYATGEVVTVDVIDPMARIYRNTVAEVNGPVTLADLLSPWPEADRIDALKMPGARWLQTQQSRVHLAFVDGKHSGSVVKQEGVFLWKLQEAGDVIVYDDVHLPEIWQAVKSVPDYAVERIDVLPERAYAVAVRQ